MKASVAGGAGYIRSVVTRRLPSTVGQVTGRAVPVTVGTLRTGGPARLVAFAAPAAARFGRTPELTLHHVTCDAWDFAQVQTATA